jgi:hypothetical protein
MAPRKTVSQRTTDGPPFQIESGGDEFDMKSFAIAAPRVQLPIGEPLHGGRDASACEGRPVVHDDALRGHLVLRWSRLRPRQRD